MKITKISVFQVDLPFNGGTYKLSGGRSWTSMDSTIVRIDTDDGIAGWGETCPFGPNYLEAFARGARAGIGELAPSLLGQDPSQPKVIYDVMNHNMLGHPYVKHGIDMACWDILGKLNELPLYTLFGGKLNEQVGCAGGIPPEHGELMDTRIATVRANGCSQFSTKASGDIQADINFITELGKKLLPGESVKVDANRGWRVDEAIRVMQATSDLDIYFEQPCWSYEECRSVRQATGRPLVLDECLLDTRTLLRSWNDGVCDAINLKIGRVGGLTVALEMRDLCIELGIPLHVQCAGGGNITQAAIVHLAQSVPANRLLWVWDIGDLVSLETVSNPIRQVKGKMQAYDLPGLGVEPLAAVLGEPVAVYD